MRISLYVLLTAALFGCAGTLVGNEPAKEVYLLRHAEKQTGSDPALTVAGKARAERVAAMLKPNRIEAVYSTDYRRTRATAAPIARAAGVTVTIYDPRQPEQLVDRIRTTSGNAVVVGHSNTIPTLVQLLGGEPGEPMTESDYDRLYRLRLSPSTSETTVMHTGR